MLERAFVNDNVGYEIELPEDTSVWTGEINKILFSTYPELASFPIKLIIDKFEPQKLYAKGSFVVDASGSSLVIPVLIKNKKLQPFDIALLNGKWRYMSNKLITDLINGRLDLGVAMNNKDSIDFYAAGLSNNVPNNTGTRNFREITASVISPDQREELARRITTDSCIKSACVSNQNLAATLTSILSKQPSRYKSAFISRDGFLHGHIYLTKKNGDREKLATSFAEAKSFVKKYMPDKYVDFIKTGSLSILGDDSEDSMLMPGISGILNKIMKKVSNPGMFSFMHGEGFSPVMVIKIKSVGSGGGGKGMLGKLLGLSHGGMMHDVDDDTEAVPMKGDCSSILSSFDKKSPDDLIPDDDILINNSGEYLEPITVHKTMDMPIGKVIIGETKQGGDAFVGVILSKLDRSKTASDAGLPEGNRVILSPNAVFYKVAEPLEDKFLTSKRACLSELTRNAQLLTVINRDENTVAIKCAKENIICPKNTIEYQLNSFGIKKADIADAIPMLEADGKVDFIIPLRNKVKISSALKAKISKIDWLKVASIMPTEETIDSALALDYLDDNTTGSFYKAVPVYRNALAEMAKLMAGVRLGNNLVSEETLKTAMATLDDLITELTAYREGI